MKTSVNIPDSELKELMKNTAAKTKKEAIVRAIKDFNHRQRMGKLTKYLGTFDDFISQDELIKARKGNVCKAR